MAKKQATTNILVNPYQSDPFSKGYEVKLPPSMADTTHPQHVDLTGKGMRSGKGK